MHKKEYQIIGKKDTKKLAQFLSKEGQLLLPMLELITQAEMAVDELIDLTGRAAIEAVLTLSAQQVAGAKHQGKPGGAIGWHGSQKGVVPLSDRKLRVEKPRLRRKGKGPQKEVEIPAYEAMLGNNSGIRYRTGRVKNWQDAGMVIRWVAASLMDMEKRFRRIMGYQQLWILEAHLDESANDKKVARKGKVA